MACPGERPLQIFVTDQLKELESQIAELEEKTLPAKVIAHLKDVSAITVLELGLYQMGTLYEIFAFEIAYWLAETKQGLIQSHRGLWYDRRENRNKPIL